MTGVISYFEAAGGEEAFERIVDRFYAGVAADPLLRPMYPATLDAPREHLRRFLIQYWGEPGTYSEQRGHPRLRMRHAPFRIGMAEREAWITHMRAAVREERLDPQVERVFLEYFENASLGLINVPGEALS